MALRLRSGRWLPLVISAMLAALVILPMAVGEAQAQTSVPGARSSLATVSRDGGAFISWRIPDRAEEDGVTGYSLRHRPLGGGNWTSMNVPVPDGEAVVALATITGLTNRRHYEVQVAGVNSIGTSQYASVVATPQGEQSQPTDTGDEDLSVGALNAVWIDPNDDNEIHPGAIDHHNLIIGDHCTGIVPFSFSGKIRSF